eukprot:84878_1
MHSANILITSGEGKNANNNPINTTQSITVSAETALSKYTAYDDGIKEELHSFYHSNKQSKFEEFAILLNFTLSEIVFLQFFIEARHANLGCIVCNNGNNDINKLEQYKRIEQENCDEINKYFDQTINNIIKYHQQHILKQYKQISKEKLHQLKSNNNKHHKIRNVEIKFKSITHELDELLTNCYSIINNDLPEPPIIKIKHDTLYDDDLEICIMDKNKEMNDKYEILLNNKILIPFNNITKEHKLNIKKNIKPLCEYSISVRKHIKDKNEWSEYSKPMKITTDFKCIWSQNIHGKNVYFTPNNKYIVCKSNYGDCTIICDPKYVITSTMFKEIAFYFKIEEFAQDSYFGFVQYPIGVEKDWNILMHKNEYSYCLRCNNGSNEIKRYIKGLSKGTKKWTGWSSSIKLCNGYKIKNGDIFIFVINFDEMNCNVFINEINNENNKISLNLNELTFDNIPHKIIPFYSHQHNEYSATHSKVTVSVYHHNYKYKLR